MKGIVREIQPVIFVTLLILAGCSVLPLGDPECLGSDPGAFKTMLKHTILKLSLAAMFTGLAVIGCSPPAAPQIHVEDAWSRPASAGGTGVAYMTITNEGGVADTLAGAQSDIAETVELHRTTMENDVMSMQPVENVEVPARSQVKFEPGGVHVMLIRLRQTLEPSARFQLTLQFEESGAVPVEVEVQEP